MKNKAITSFCINLLVGLLFCFPVFSAQHNSTINFASEVSISCNELWINHVADSNHKLKKEFPKSYNLVKSKSAPKKAFDKKSFTAQHSPHVKYYINHYSDLASLFKKHLNSFYVNQSLLTELEVTKMRC
ncbi:MAG: hypothetical protein ABIY50_13210 [Ignavibacteria bacterium]